MTSVRSELCRRRKDLGLTVYELARRARAVAPTVRGLQQPAFKAWEDGAAGRSPSDEQLVAWAAALGMTIELKPAPETAAKEKAA